MTRKIHDPDYLFLTTRVRALEGCLLNRGQMEQMLEAGSPEEAARILTCLLYTLTLPTNREV